jgi:O-antigen ligase
MDWTRADLPILFIVAGLSLTWKECEKILYAVALGGCVQMLWARMFDTEGGDRLGLQVGSLVNSNDYAAHMILSLGFVLWLALNAKKAKIIRVGAFIAVIFGLLLIVRTASRGALISLLVISLIFLYRASTTQRLMMIVVAPIVFAIVLVSVPKGALTRITSFSENEQGASAEALESSNARQYLLRKSIEYTFTHPIFGVGLGQFASFEGANNQVIGGHGMWHETHNTYTQVSSETGLPGLTLYLGAVFSIIGAFRMINSKARKRPDCRDIAVASFCALISTVGFCVCVTFLSFGYFFYLPFLGGLAVAMWRAADREFQDRVPPQPISLELMPGRKRIIRSAAEPAAV